jgi:hypothetical protein
LRHHSYRNNTTDEANNQSSAKRLDREWKRLGVPVNLVVDQEKRAAMAIGIRWVQKRMRCRSTKHTSKRNGPRINPVTTDAHQTPDAHQATAPTE